MRYRTTSSGAWVYVVARRSRDRGRRGDRRAGAPIRPRSLPRPAALASATATQATKDFVPSAAQGQQEATGAPLTGQPLAGAGDAEVTAALSALCHLQISAAS